ncbi:MAG: threonine ammonia-lyase [Gammaproteobacteria bacterium]|nr:threonine ammonia-lyase [Gammaproteobacteria bacterium]
MLALADIQSAKQRIGDAIFVSPCTRTETLSKLTGCEVFLKLENLQMTGSFKERGSLNKILQLTDEQRAAGVITASAGNHAQGVAHAAKLCGIPAVIVMPETTPLAKIQGTQEFGAETLLYGSGYDEAYTKALELQTEKGYTFVHAFDDPLVIAGQGTIGLELLEQVPDMDTVLVPIGGGGLISGIATAIKTQRPEVRMIGVEAAVIPAMQQSITAGAIQSLDGVNTLADGIAVGRVGEYTLPTVERLVSDIVTVNEEEIATAIMLLLEREKTLVEGAGAVGFAALHSKRIPDISGKQVVVVISGGNIDLTLLAKILERGMETDGRLARFKVIAADRPRSIAKLTALIAEQHAGILQMTQNRSISKVRLEETEVELLLETRGLDHVEAISQLLRDEGFGVK